MKIGVVGAGHVGATSAQKMAERELGDVVLVDIAEGLARGLALDIAESGPIDRFGVRVSGASDMEALAGAGLIVITAGSPRKPGMSRDDLLFTNADIVRSVAEGVRAVAPHAILIIVTNPLDAMAAVALKASGFPPERVVGMAATLDTARFRTFIAEALDVAPEDVTAFVLGGHGDAMVPLPRYTSVAGIPLAELLDEPTIARLVQRTRDGGAEIVGHLKTGSAYYAPAAAVAEMAAAIVRDRKRILPCAAWLTGHYGIHDLYLGVPVKLGARGVESIIEIGLTPEEAAALQASADRVRESLSKLEL